MLTPEDILIAEAKVRGLSLRQIEALTGIDDSKVARRLSKPELKEYIEKLHHDLIASSLHHAISNIHHAVSSYQKVETDPQLRDHGHKLNIQLAQSVGILPANSQTIMIQQIYNENKHELPEAIKRLFEAVTHNDKNGGRNLLDDGRVIDIDSGDDKGKRGTK